MDTIRLALRRPLKNVRMLSAEEAGSILTASPPPEFGETPKLLATPPAEDAKNCSTADLELQGLLIQLGEQIQRQAAQATETIEQFRELSVRLALEIASAVVRSEVNDHETRIRQLLQELMVDQENQTPLVVYVNKHDLERLKSSFKESPDLLSMIQWKTDATIAPGDVRIETAEERVIANSHQQLASIQLQLMEYLSDARLRSSRH
jgi:hypothetical protein